MLPHLSKDNQDEISKSDFLQLGGDSVSAMEFLSRLQKVFGVKIHAAFLLKNRVSLGEIEQMVTYEKATGEMLDRSYLSLGK